MQYDFTSMTPDEIRDLVTAATLAYRDAEAAKQAETDASKAQILEAADTLESLLGPEGSAPYNPATGDNATINGVLAHDTEDHAVLAQNVGLALSLILRAMKVDVSVGAKMGRILGSQN